MRYGLVFAAAAATLSISAISAGAQVVRLTPANAAWCRVDHDRCADVRDVRYDRRDTRRDARDIAWDRREIRADHRAVRRDVRDIRLDRAYHDPAAVRADERSAAAAQRAANAEYRDMRRQRSEPRTPSIAISSVIAAM